MKEITLQDGEIITIDAEDYSKVSPYNWYKCYHRNNRRIRTTIDGRAINLQTYLMKGSTQIIKNNDFRKSNLKIADHNAFRRPSGNSISRYKGVSLDRRANKWVAAINVSGKRHHLGRFTNEDDAGRAYNDAVINLKDGEGFINTIGEDNRAYREHYEISNKKRRRAQGVTS